MYQYISALDSDSAMFIHENTAVIASSGIAFLESCVLSTSQMPVNKAVYNQNHLLGHRHSICFSHLTVAHVSMQLSVTAMLEPFPCDTLCKCKIWFCKFVIWHIKKIYSFHVIGFLGLHLGNTVGSTEHWCDVVLPSVLSRVFVSWLCVLVCVVQCIAGYKCVTWVMMTREQCD